MLTAKEAIEIYEVNKRVGTLLKLIEANIRTESSKGKLNYIQTFNVADLDYIGQVETELLSSGYTIVGKSVDQSGKWLQGPLQVTISWEDLQDKSEIALEANKLRLKLLIENKSPEEIEKRIEKFIKEQSLLLCPLSPTSKHVDDGGFLIGSCKYCKNVNDSGGVGCI